MHYVMYILYYNIIMYTTSVAVVYIMYNCNHVHRNIQYMYCIIMTFDMIVLSNIIIMISILLINTVYTQ